MSGVFVTATGTGCGKTWIARGLARAMARSGHRVAALKPIETGGTLDAVALARAAGRPELADAAGLRRFRAPLSPRAAELMGETAVDPVALAAAVRVVLEHCDLSIVEGAGGLCTPIARGLTMADLASALRLPLLLVAPNALGTLSHTITAIESAERRELVVAAVVLVASERLDGSETHNRAILEEMLDGRFGGRLRVVEVRRCRDDDDDLAAAVQEVGLLEVFDTTGS